MAAAVPMLMPVPMPVAWLTARNRKVPYLTFCGLALLGGVVGFNFNAIAAISQLIWEEVFGAEVFGWRCLGRR